MNQCAKKIVSILCILTLSFALISIEVFADVETMSLDGSVGSWTLKEAVYDEDSKEFILTENSFHEKGAIWYDKVYYSDFEIELDYYTGNRKSSGADGITVAFYANQDYELLDGANMAFSGCKGYGIELDIWENKDFGDPTYNHIALVKEKSDNHIIMAELSESEDGEWHHLKISVESGNCEVYVDSSLKFTYPVESTGYGEIGITAATCAGTCEHKVKNIVINGINSVDGTGGDQFTDSGNDLESVSFLSNYDVDTNQAIFNNTPLAYTPSADADLSFKNNLDDLIGKYVLVEQSDNPLEFKSISSVESKIGTVSAMTMDDIFLKTLTVDDTEYSVVKNRFIAGPYQQGEKVLFHLKDGVIVGIEQIQEKTGFFETWNGITQIATIDSKVYPTNYLTDKSFLANVDQRIGKEVIFCTTSASDYMPMLGIVDYETKTGTLSNYDGSENNMAIDGTTYTVDGSQCEPVNSELINKKVFFLLKNGKVVHVDAMERITPLLQVTLSPASLTFTYANNAWDSNSESIEVDVRNLCGYDFPTGYDRETIYADNYFDNSSMKLNLQDAVWGTSDAFSFNEIDAAATWLRLGETKTATVSVKPKAGYIPSEKTDTQRVSLMITAENGNGTIQKSTGTLQITIKKNDIQSEENNGGAEIKVLSKKASGELAAIQSQITLDQNTMKSVFGIDGAEYDALKAELLSAVVMSNAPKKDLLQSIEDDAADELFTRCFSKYKIDVSGSTYTVPRDYIWRTPKYGRVTVRFKCRVTQYGIGSSSDFFVYAPISYEVSSFENPMPELYQNGKIGQIAQTDVSAFAKAAYELAEAELKQAYDMAWGNKANQVADILFDKTIKDILNASQISFKDSIWEVITWPTKNIINHCPTDIFIYNKNGVLCGAIENNVVTKTSDAFDLYVGGDTKYITGLEDGYKVRYVATGNGTMNVEVTEYLGYEKPLRQIFHYNVPLQTEMYYTQDISEELQPPVEEYQLVSNANEEIPADETKLLVTLDPAGKVAYRIVLNGNGGKVTPEVLLTDDAGCISELPIPIRENYVFDGWYTEIQNGVRVTNKMSFSKDVIIYAHWSNSGGNSGGGIVPPCEMPLVQKPMISVDENATVTLSKDGTTAKIIVANGYEIADVTVNGVSKGKVDKLDRLKTGDKIVVATVKIETIIPTDPDNTQTSTAAKIKAAKAVTLKASSSLEKTKKGKRYIKVKWTKKGAAVTGYQVYRSKKKAGGYKKFFTTKNKYYYNTKSLKKGKRYYYKVRAYTVINGKKCYSKWSNVVYRTVKK